LNLLFFTKAHSDIWSLNVTQIIRHTLACFAVLGLAATASGASLPKRAAAGVNLEGVWQITTPISSLKPAGGGAIPFTDKGQQRYAENMRYRDAKNFDEYDRMTSRCAAPGATRVMMTPKRFRILQQPDVIMLGFEWNRVRRVIRMPTLPEQAHVFFLDDLAQAGTTMGTSKGQWEKDTLVVKTDEFSDQSLLDDLLPHGFDLRLTEHIRLIGPNTLEDRIEIEDPEYYTKPWQAVLTYQRRPESLFAEEVCLDTLQKSVPLPDAAGIPPTGEQAQPDPHFGFGVSRAPGLKIGEHGFTVGPGGGLDFELRNNGFAVPMPGPLPANQPKPTSDPRDFSGAWEQADQYLEEFERLTDMYGSKLPFTALGRKIMDRRLLAQDAGKPYVTPSVMCRPSGPDWPLIHIPVRIYQTKDRLDVFSPMDRTWWQIPVNPALALSADTRTYMGRSKAHWEHNELVVETSGFKNRLWLTFRGTPLSPNGRLVHRIRKINAQGSAHLQVVTEVNDPDYYSRPWQFARMLAWRPDMGIQYEYSCEEGVAKGIGDTGAEPEPND
jgi:hypothetical protein